MSENIIYCYSGSGHCLDMAKSIAQRYDACLRSGKFHKPAQQKAAYGSQRVQNKPAPQPETTESDDDLPF